MGFCPSVQLVEVQKASQCLNLDVSEPKWAPIYLTLMAQTALSSSQLRLSVCERKAPELLI